MKHYILTIIVPLDLKRRSKDLITKTLQLVQSKETKDYIFHIAINYRNKKNENFLIRKLKECENVKFFLVDNHSQTINTSLLRNVAAQEIKTDISLLLDADLHPDKKIFDNCIRRIQNNEDNMIILPCLYLSQKGTRLLVNNKITRKNLIEDFLKFKRSNYKHLASPSSIVFFKSKDYWKIGGFDEKYNNHGYEDFDFLIRLSIYHGLISYQEDFYENETCRAPLFATGFRRELGILCLKNLLNKQIIFHKYHDKNPDDTYYFKRNENFLYMKKKLNKIFKENKIILRPKNNRLLIDQYFSLCESRNINHLDYTILFDNRPGYVDRGETKVETFLRISKKIIKKYLGV